MIYVNFDKYGVLNHIEYNDEVIFKGNNNVNKVFVCFDGIELKPQHYLTYSALINDKDYSGNLTDLASVRTTYNGKDGYMFSIFSNLTKNAGTLKLSIRLVDRLTDTILVSGILPLIVQDSAVSTYSNVNINTTQYQALLTAFDDLAQTFNETNFKTINEESLFGEGNITLPTVEYVDLLDTNLREVVNDNITNLNYADEELRNQINEQNKVIEKQDRRIKILELASEGNTLLTNTEDGIAYEVNVTSDALPFAEINKIGGMTYKSNNLANQDIAKPLNTGYFNTTQGAFGKVESGKQYTFSVKYVSSVNSTKSLGLRAMSNSDGGGTNLGHLTTITLTKGQRTSITFTSSYNGYVGLNGSGFDSSDTITDITLNEGSSDLGYQPYFEGLRNSAVNQVVVKGANVLNPSLLATKDATFTKQSDDSYVSKALGSYGTAYFNATWSSQIGAMVSSEGIPLKKGTYYISFKAKLNSGTSNGGLGISITLQNDKNIVGGIVLNPPISSSYQVYSRSFTLTSDDKIGFIFQVASGASNAIIQIKDIMIAKGETDYKPYKEPTTYTIPTTITSIDGYGLGIDETYYNYVDFANRKFVKNVGVYTFNGSESLEQIATNTSGVYRYRWNGVKNFIAKPNTSSVAMPVILEGELPYKSVDANYLAYEGVAIHPNGDLYIFKQDIQTITDMKTYLTGKTLIYPLATPTETDLLYRITDDFIIEIEGNGTIIFDNQYEQAIPYSWTYQEKL